MNITKLIILIIIVIGFGAWFFWPNPAPLYPTTGTNIVVFGDSLAAGVGSNAGGDFASRLSVALGTDVLNLGVSGDTTSDGLARVGELIASDPKIVILLLGGNDAIKKVPVETTFSNLATIIEQIQTTGAAVILVGEPGGLYGSQYEKEYERLAEEYRTFYVSNILSGLIGRSQYMSDFIHPNDKGYEMATERILPVVEEVLAGE